MGQYHKVYNITKKEYIRPHSIDNGLKLMEQVGWNKSTSVERIFGFFLTRR